MIGNEKKLSEEKVQSILQEIVGVLVSDPTSAHVKLDSYEDKLEFGIDVPSEERAKIIGSNGRVINGLQNVIGAMGGKIGKDVKIDILE